MSQFLNSNNFRTLEALLTVELQELYLKWAASQPLRSGLHASSLLVSQNEWCVRRYVLMELFPKEAEPEQLHHWDWRRQAIFDNGWSIHERWQKLFKQFANVVHTVINHDQYSSFEPELDLTHHDETRNIYFSPDAIIDYAGTRYVVEIKGLDTRKFQELTDNLDTACKVSPDVVGKARVQCNLYCHLLEIEHGLLLIEDKNTQQIKVWIIQCDPALAMPYVQRAYDVKGRVALVRHSGPEKMPERVCQSSNDRLAQRCSMRVLCFANEKEE